MTPNKSKPEQPSAGVSQEAATWLSIQHNSGDKWAKLFAAEILTFLARPEVRGMTENERALIDYMLDWASWPNQCKPSSPAKTQLLCDAVAAERAAQGIERKGEKA